jgi:hypothetical protein
MWLYMGLCAIAFGTFVYAWRCPQEIKKYGDYKDYANGDGPVLRERSEAEISEQLEKAGYDAAFSQGNDLLFMHYDMLDKSNPLSRLVVTTCFASGFAILTALSLRVFFRIVGLMIGL